MPLAFVQWTGSGARKYRHKMPGQTITVANFFALVLTALGWMAFAALIAIRIYNATSGIS
jgi:hypothetical protein